MLTEAHEGSLLTVKEAAAKLGLHPMTVRKMIRQQRLPAVQLGGPGTSVRAANPPAPPPPPAAKAPSETEGQKNARETAEDYLSTQAFSRTGLLRQLKFEGYILADATYAVAAVKANWNQQAAKAAGEYLDSQSFSRIGLIRQLEFDGFTASQATYGVNQTGL